MDYKYSNGMLHFFNIEMFRHFFRFKINHTKNDVPVPSAAKEKAKKRRVC
jgi:hypothetical protein